MAYITDEWAIRRHSTCQPDRSQASRMTSFFFRYASTTGLGTVFSGLEMLTNFGQKKVLWVFTKASP